MIGTVLSNRYEIIELIGSGGMANVYRAKDRLLNRFVAVKVLRPEFKDDQDFIRRFNTESQAAASLSHKNIVSIYDVGEQDNFHYIVMEFVEGKTLKAMVKEQGVLPWKEAVGYAIQICEALEHAHSKHIVHRDIKPQNIMVTPDGQIKVMDFGIARASGASTTKLGDTALGSAHYLSPEQARGGYTDNRTDIYSLGVVMYEMFTGKVPFDGDSPIAVAMQHIQKQAQVPSAVNPSLPPSLSNVVMKAMNKEQRLRYDNAEQLHADLTAVYTDPTATIQSSVPNEDDEFMTQKFRPIKDDDLERVVSTKEQQPVRREKLKTKQKKEDRNAITAAIITSVVLVVLAGIFAARIFWGVSFGSEKIPNLLGKTVTEASLMVEDMDIEIVESGSEYHDTIEEGKIISQTPEANSSAKNVTAIEVVISKGPESATLDDYTGMDYREAKIALNNLKLTVVIKQEASNTVSEGVVIRQDPAKGSDLKAGATITLYVSSGQSEENILVPDLLGMTKSEAKVVLEDSNLRLGTVSTVESSKPEGQVVSQNPRNGSLEVGESVDITVSAGKKATEKPKATDEPSENSGESGSGGSDEE